MGEYIDDDLNSEFRKYQAIVVKEYLPLLNALAAAGILYVWIKDLNADRQVESVCENGGFQLNAETYPVDLASPRLYQEN
jgi:hypothetical protein